VFCTYIYGNEKRWNADETERKEQKEKRRKPAMKSRDRNRKRNVENPQ
jgi:hypothetical protein